MAASKLTSVDLHFMKKALQLANRAFQKGEVPIGALIVQNGKVVGRGFNNRETHKCPTDHAEVLAIQAASRRLKAWRLTNTTLYCTLEPCLMCYGAIIAARIDRVVYGAKCKTGVCGSLVDLTPLKLGHYTEVEGGVMSEESTKLIKDFFLKIRGTDVEDSQIP
eukprot:TRINITY_DN8886_c0_g1_i1.p1 TRINITY_DN8886_c0_g1~~TRINITY_DN8886_c0_g1_i1.p1  ORF type:complete len:164 (-),score=22.16 TRINITY_DN8886_c0_g1_i1:122-613(-)